MSDLRERKIKEGWQQCEQKKERESRAVCAEGCREGERKSPTPTHSSIKFTLTIGEEDKRKQLEITEGTEQLNAIQRRGKHRGWSWKINLQKGLIFTEKMEEEPEHKRKINFPPPILSSHRYHPPPF